MRRTPAQRAREPLRSLVAALGLGAASTLASAAGAPGVSLQFCDSTPLMSALQQDRLLRFAAAVRHELEDSGGSLALISRTGTDLSRFGIRYSHAGLSLKANRNGPWSVRQLYYACEEHRPRLFDQGLAGFLFGSDDPVRGFVSIVPMPDGPGQPGAALEQAALDNPRALRLLAARYSANAYPFSTAYQNCNQWVAELLASAWAPLPDGADLRPQAQRWLADQAYAPTPVELHSHLLMALAPFVPLVHVNDHPIEDQYALHFFVSLPASLEGFVHQRLPQAQRVELCHDRDHVVIHHGWEPLPDDCSPLPGDRVITLD